MNYGSRASSSPDAMGDREWATLARQTAGDAGPADDLPVSVKPAPMITAHDATMPEINISVSHLLAALVVAFCLAGTLVWLFVRYWLFAP
jgi:hypothetical protein